MSESVIGCIGIVVAIIIGLWIMPTIMNNISMIGVNVQDAASVAVEALIWMILSMLALIIVIFGRDVINWIKGKNV